MSFMWREGQGINDYHVSDNEDYHAERKQIKECTNWTFFMSSDSLDCSGIVSLCDYVVLCT